MAPDYDDQHRKFQERHLHMSVIDQEARDMARNAIAMITAHEKVCAVRAQEAITWRVGTTGMLSDISKAVAGLYSRLWIAACGVIVVLIGAVGFLIQNKGL